MIIKSLKNILSIFRKKERFLIIEILDYFLRVSHARADFDRKEIYLIKTLALENSLANLGETFKKLERLLKYFGNPSSYSIILNLDSAFATTIHSSVSLIRNHPREPIDEADLDNLISQAVWKMFDRYRAKVAFKMAASDLDVLLTDIQIKRIKLDGYKVVNPLGFQARSVEIGLSQTFVVRNFINSLKNILPKEKVILINEAGASWASTLRQNGDTDNYLFVNLFPHATSMFLAHGTNLLFLDTFDWGEKNLKASIAKNLSVSDEIAKTILNRYVSNDVSETFSNRISKILNEEFQILFKGIESRLKKTGVRTIYFLPFFVLPTQVFPKGLKNHFKHSVKISEVNSELFRSKFNFDVKLKKSVFGKSVFPILAGLIQFYISPSDDRIRKMATRRIRWLAD